jgi:hypothetical protein
MAKEENTDIFFFQPPPLVTLILRLRRTPAFRTGSKAPLSINPEQIPSFRPGIVEGLIWAESSYCGQTYLIINLNGLVKGFFRGLRATHGGGRKS